MVPKAPEHPALSVMCQHVILNDYQIIMLDYMGSTGL